jgi:hypothetical protein
MVAGILTTYLEIFEKSLVFVKKNVQEPCVWKSPGKMTSWKVIVKKVFSFGLYEPLL